ncbi:MAG: hypothetical protein ACRDK7_08570 [Solirubrobacteraceae bacterium]
MAHAVKTAHPSTAKQRPTPGERGRGLLADLTPGRSLADELIAERHAEAHAEDRNQPVPATRHSARR